MRSSHSCTTAAPKPKRGKKPPLPKPKHDPKLVAAARELRDRHLERFNAGRILPQGKYDIAVALPVTGAASQPAKALPPLAA